MEVDGPLSSGVERVVPANAHAHARLESSASLAHDDLAPADNLTTKRLDAKPLAG
jgi:hypothetical protein